MIKHFDRNTCGRDYVVGDIHGCFSRLQAHLDAIGFNPDAGDRLFSVGDLVDRGPESESALDWLARPWFHAVRGNHEQMAIDWAEHKVQPNIYAANGGMWNIGNPEAECRRIADAFRDLPIAMQVVTEAGLVGIVHADCTARSWDDLSKALDNPHMQGMCIWSRHRINQDLGEYVDGVRAVVVGHTPVKKMLALGNVLYIDTGAVFGGHDFTILDMETLKPVIDAGER